MSAEGQPAVSCGVLLLNEADELLLCHVTGASHWDIPKGCLDEGETPWEAVIREAREETGLMLRPDRLLELGRLAYRPDKALHLFLGNVSRLQLDPATCVCTSYFEHPTSQRLLPEVDAFAWVHWTAIRSHCAKRMGAVLTETLGLNALRAIRPERSCLA